MIRAFGCQKVKLAIEEVQPWVCYQETGQDLVHIAAYYGLYDCILDIMISELGYDVDFYQPPYRKLTLLHTVVKYRKHMWSEEEKAHIKRLI